MKIKKVFPRRKLFTSLTLVAAAITLLAVGYFASAPSGVSLKVPNVVGLTESEARVLLKDFNINIERAPDAKIETYLLSQAYNFNGLFSFLGSS